MPWPDTSLRKNRYDARDIGSDAGQDGGDRALRTFEDRLERLVALLYGPPMKTIAAEVLERRGEIARLYVSWMMGEIEEPEFEDPEDARLWEKMAAYEEAAPSVADAPTEEDLAVVIPPRRG
jgi:hypothetical protein